MTTNHTLAERGEREITQADREQVATHGLRHRCWTGRYAIEVADGLHDDVVREATLSTQPHTNGET